MNEETIKIIAMYLPQFYATEDNNQWWEEGICRMDISPKC